MPSEHVALRGPWEDCLKFLPYRDYCGRLVLAPRYTQRSRAVVKGKVVYQYREREEDDAEWLIKNSW